VQRPAAPKAAAQAPAPPQPAAHVPAFKPGDNVEVVPMSVMRRKIAEHMVLSRRTSAHVHSVFEVDYTRVAKIRAARKADYERQGVKLTYMSFLMKATVDALVEDGMVREKDKQLFDFAEDAEDVWAKLVARGLKAHTPASQAPLHPAQKL